MIALQSLIERAARLNGHSVATSYKGNKTSWTETQRPRRVSRCWPTRPWPIRG